MRPTARCYAITRSRRATPPLRRADRLKSSGISPPLRAGFLRRRGRLLCEAAQRLARQFIEAALAVCGELLAHALGPELIDGIGDAGHAIFPHGFGTKKPADVVRHLHEVLRAAVYITTHGSTLFGDEQDIRALHQRF